VNDCVAEVGEEVVEHIFSEITRPPFLGVLKISCSMDENHGGVILYLRVRKEETGRHFSSIVSGEINYLWVSPGIGGKFLRLSRSKLFCLRPGRRLLQVQFPRFVTV